jgi:phospholipid/cholesterol/gamma-HCH transport system permease protein
MKQTEQTDAVEMLGQSVMGLLVGPRVLACILAAPLLHVVVSVSAIIAGWISQSLSAPMDWSLYWRYLIERVDFFDVVSSGCKTFVFGAIVGVCACHAGLAADGGSESVGRAATSGVVRAIFLILIADTLLVTLIRMV